MNALPKSTETPSPWWSTLEFPWADTARLAPVMVATMASYLDQLGVSARPRRSLPPSRHCVISPAR